jgi:hypothetical protein
MSLSDGVESKTQGENVVKVLTPCSLIPYQKPFMPSDPEVICRVSNVTVYTYLFLTLLLQFSLVLAA